MSPPGGSLLPISQNYLWRKVPRYNQGLWYESLLGGCSLATAFMMKFKVWGQTFSTPCRNEAEVEREIFIPPTLVHCCSSSLHTQTGPPTTSLQQPMHRSKHSSNTHSNTHTLTLLPKHSHVRTHFHIYLHAYTTVSTLKHPTIM